MPPQESNMATPKKDLHTVGGKKLPVTQNTLKGKSVAYEEFPADMVDPLGEAFVDGDLVALDDIINEIVEVSGFDRREGLYGPFYTVHIDGDRIFNIGSAGVMERLDKVEESLPMKMVFVRKELAGNKRMYSVVSQQTFMRMEQSGELQG